MNLTKTVNIFNQTKRDIRCIAKKHDYLGTGEMIVHEELEVGRIYTFIHGRAASYGNMVYLREYPSRWGYQAYLFEELESYDEEEYDQKSREWLVRMLDESIKGIRDRKTDASEERQRVRDKLRRLVREAQKFQPSFTEGHDTGAAYWIYPVTVRDSDRIEDEDLHVYANYEISIPERYFDPLLIDFFTEGIDPDLPINAHRYSTDDCPEGLPIYGFEWYLHPNFYTYEQMKRILFQIERLAKALEMGFSGDASERQKERLRLTFAKAAEEKPDLTYEGAMKVTATFYRSLAERIRRMMDECREADIICLMGP